MLKMQRFLRRHEDPTPDRPSESALMVPTRRTVVTGDVGAGKTWLCAILAAQGGDRVVALTEATTWPGGGALTYGPDLTHVERPDAPKVMADLVRAAAARALADSAMLVLDCPVWDGPLTMRDAEPTTYLHALQDVWSNHDGQVILTAYPQDLERSHLELGRYAHLTVARHHAPYAPAIPASSPETGWGTAIMTSPDGSVTHARIPYLSRDTTVDTQPPSLEIEP